MTYMTPRERARYIWTLGTCNWFTLRLTCQLKGHSRREYRLFGVGVNDCDRCGKFFGLRGQT